MFPKVHRSRTSRAATPIARAPSTASTASPYRHRTGRRCLVVRRTSPASTKSVAPLGPATYSNTVTPSGFSLRIPPRKETSAVTLHPTSFVELAGRLPPGRGEPRLIIEPACPCKRGYSLRAEWAQPRDARLGTAPRQGRPQRPINALTAFFVPMLNSFHELRVLPQKQCKSKNVGHYCHAPATRFGARGGTGLGPHRWAKGCPFNWHDFCVSAS